jgi:hypothetical protein
MRYTNTQEGDLVLEADLLIDRPACGPWTFPEIIKGLPKEANELRLGHMRGAPTMNYVREDVVEELRRKAKLYDEYWGPTWPYESEDFIGCFDE